MHWGYGIAWGGLFGLVAGSLRAPKVRHGLALGASVWTSSYVLLPLAGLYRPIWEYAARVLARDLGDHLVYGVGAAAPTACLPGGAPGKATVGLRAVAEEGSDAD